MSFRRFLLVSLLAGMSCAASNKAFAQGYLQFPEWLEVGTLGASHHPVLGFYSAYYFFDATHGLAATTGSEIFYIANPSEGEWDLATVPSGFTTVRMFRFIQGKLFAANDGPDALVSSDSGKTWAFAGLGLGNANDLYADANGTIRALKTPMKSFARIDTMNCVAVGGGSLFVSSDGGLNWTTSVTGIDPLSLGAFGDACRGVFICPSTWGTAVLRSSDSGKTWKNILTGASPYPEYIVGASTTCYENDTGGMFRSIDNGLTWTSIITVNYGPHFPMYVWGPMGEQAVLSYSDQWGYEPWMTTTGGDDNLHSAVAMTDSNGAPLMQEDTMDVPFRVVSFCNSFQIPVALEADVPGLGVSVTLSNNSGGDYSIASRDSFYFSTPVLDQRYAEDTIWMAYQPHHLVDTALLTFHNTWNCSAWTETRSVIITSIPSASLLPPAPIAGSCHPAQGAAIAQLDSCTWVVIDSVIVPPNIASRLYPAHLPDTLRPGFDSLFFTFDPSDTVATILANVQVFGHFFPSAGLDSTLNYFNFNVAWTGQDSDFSFFSQSMPIKLIALPAGIALFSEDSAVSLLRPNYCQQELDTTITFTNKGCTPDTITSAALAGTGYSMPNVTLPIILPADSSVFFPIHFLAPDTNAYSGSLTVQAISGTSESLAVSLSGVGFPHVGALAASVPSIDFGTSYQCQERDTFVVISDTGCDSVCISGITLLGTGFTLPNANAVCLAHGQTDTIAIHTQIDTSGGQTTNTATLTIANNGHQPLQAITLSREIQYPVEWSLHLSPADSASAGSGVTYEIIQSGTLPPDVDSLDVAISYTDDLLKFLSVDENNVHAYGYDRSSDGRGHIRLALDSMGNDSVIATLHFIAYVTKEIQTFLTIDSIGFHSLLGRPAACIASLNANVPTTSFTLIQQCGTQELTNDLGSGSIVIDNIEPNPATDAITVSIASPAKAEGELRVVDAIGRTVFEQSVALSADRENQVPLSIDAYPSGVYSVQLCANGVTSKWGFVKE